MRKMKKIIVVWLVMMVLMGGMIGVVSTVDGAAEVKPESTGKTLSSHAPIYIEGNAGFTKPDPVNGGGTGTEIDPYIIENWGIDASTGLNAGIQIINTDVYFIIRNCVIHDGKSNYNYGVYFCNAQNGKMDDVTSYNNWYGIYLWVSSNNNITNCAVYNNSYGIYLVYSSNNKFRNNVLNNNTYNFGVYGWYISDYYQDIDTSNTVNGKPIYYIKSQNGLVFNNTMSIGYLGLVSCTNIEVENLTLTNNIQGLLLANTSYSTITNCYVYNNSDDGIWLWFSSNNTITDCAIYNNHDGILQGGFYGECNYNQITNCNVYNNTVGIRLGSSSNNLIYNNCFNNTNNTYSEGGSGNRWNITKTPGTNIIDGSYLGGNYWSDYAGVDTNEDGLGDTSYTIPGGSGEQDNLPLVEPGSGEVLYLHVTVTANPTSISSAETSTITITVTDGTNSISGATIALISNNGGSFSSVTDNGDGTYNTTFTAPTISTQIICRITANASKTGYNDGSGYVDVTVNPVTVNHAPIVNTVTSSKTNVSTGGTVTITVDATDEDTGDTLTYHYSCTGGTISGTGSSVTWTAPGTAGNYTITVYVNDSMVNSNSKSVSVTVTSPEKAEPKGFIPAFETATLLITMIGVCAILLRKRKALTRAPSNEELRQVARERPII